MNGHDLNASRGEANVTSRLYLDHASTSFPKPRSVHAAVADYATAVGASAGRGAYEEARLAGRILADCREEVRGLLNAPVAEQVVFTANCSDALNLAIKGLIDPTRPGGHVVCTETDHNSILRPVHAMREQGWIDDFTIVPISPQTGLIDPDDVHAAIRPNTRLVAITHVSNVTGAIQPMRDIGRICRESAVPFVLDAAQSVGQLPIDVSVEPIDLLAAPGHKALHGPLGTGFLYLRPGMERRVRPLKEGGTGSQSEEPRHPSVMPDRFETGSHNVIGLAGLLAGVRWVRERTIDALASHGRGLVRTFLEGIGGVDGLRLYGPAGVRDRVGVFSVSIDGYTPGELSATLEREYGLLTRSGTHCAPLVHRRFGTAGVGGTTRVSLGPMLSTQDVRYVTDALAATAAGVRRDVPAVMTR